MPEAIPFPGAVRAIGETSAARTVRAGRDVAEHRSMLPADIDAVTRHDRGCALYLLEQLGSRDPQHQHAGEIGLRSLINSMEDDAA